MNLDSMGAEVRPAASAPWKVLVVDDDPDAHVVTRMALAGMTFEGASVEFLSAASAAEARSVLEAEPDIALILLDVVLESTSEGLRLVRTVREEMGNRMVRIVLRTGQPGVSPERKVIVEYDINDYWLKTDLTATRLFTLVYTALRSYRDLRAIAAREQALVAAEAGLQRERDFIRTLIDAAPMMVLLIGGDGRLMFANQHFLRLTGMRLDAASLKDCIAERDRIRAAAVFDFSRPMASGEGASLAVLTPDGEREVEWWVRRLDGPEADHASLLAVGLDVSERRKAELELARSQAQLVQAQKMEAIGRLTAGVAHDFNNLLAVAMGNLELIAPAVAGMERETRLLERAIRATTLGGELTHRMLAFARQQPLAPQVVRLDRVVTGMGPLLERALGEGIKVEHRSVAQPWNCRVDVAQLESAILNLAVNARDAMRGSGTIEIMVSNVSGAEAEFDGPDAPAPGEFAAVSVRDTGSGMTPEVMARAFEPFFSTKGPGEGSGLGLSMVHGFARQSGGTVRIESKLGAGTKATLLFPRVRAQETAAAGAAGPATAGHGAVLVVEDNASLRETLLTALEERGYEPVGAGNAADALTILASRPELMLAVTDIVLPEGRTGFDFARAARQIRPDLALVFVSGYSDELLDQRRLESFQAELVRKPYRVEQLAQALERARIRGIAPKS